MVNSLLLFIPVALQMFCMVVDEIYFHWERGLPRWERVGHPLDTLTVLACYVWLLAVPASAFSLRIYIGLSVFSCLFVTKDALVHSTHCRPYEHWLHAILLSVHPLVLLSAGLLWPVWHQQTLSFIRYHGFERKFLLGSTLLTLAFGIYQLIYWNFICPSPISQKQAKSTMTSTIN